MKTATRFAVECLQGTDDGPSDITAVDVAAFTARAGVGYKPKTVNEIVVGLRSLLRFCVRRAGSTYRCGRRRWRWPVGTEARCRGRLPQGPGEAILATCDRASLVGSRDFAMILLVVRLGLRAGEVTAANSMTCDGEWASWSFEAKAEVVTRSPCRSMSARR